MRQAIAAFALVASLIFPVFAQAHDASAVVASPRATYNFNAGWRLATEDTPGAEQPGFDDGAWRSVTLPNAFNETQAFARDIRDLSTGITWYRKRFTLPAGAEAGKAFLEFEGVRQAAEVWVNGKSVALSENGAMAFGADISPVMTPGENVVAVRVDNNWTYKERATGQGFQWNDRNFNVNYGGITKNVRLHLTGKLHQTLPLYNNLGTTGQYVWADGFDQKARAATIHAETQVRNDDAQARTVAYRVEVRDRGGKVVGRFEAAAQAIAPGQTVTLKAEKRLRGLNFWSWGYGYLYTVTSSLIEGGKVLDSVDTRTGFRQTKFANGMIELNGRVIQVHGYAQRTSNEWPAVGVSIPPWISDFSNALMVQSGGNLVRWMHIAPSKQDIESADRVGLIQAMPAGDAERDAGGRQWEQRVELMREAIVYSRNNPSIVFYEGGNEAISEAHMSDLKAIRDQFDPNGGRAIGSREMLDSKVAEYGGEMLYINKSARIPMWATEYSRDEGARLYQDELTPPFHKDAPPHNRNQDSHAIEDIKRWWDYYQVRPGTGSRVSSGGVNIIFSDSNTHYRGDNNYRRSGEVDAIRIPKEGFFAHKVMWSDWVDSVTPGTHIMGHWNYAVGATKEINVVSNGDAVELFLNGKSLGKGVKSSGFLYTWTGVAWEPGVLKAVATHPAGRSSQASLETTGAPVALRLKPHTSPRGFVMDGADIAMVDVEVVDAKGRRVPIANDKVQFTLEGPAEWRGGIAQGDSSGRPRRIEPVPGHDVRYPGTARDEDNYILSKALPVEGGVNRVLIRAGTTAGDVRLVASAEGLTNAALTIPTVLPQPVAGGLSIDFPEAHQPGLLTRGPTPAGPSFRVTRTASVPVGVVASTNQDTAANSIDDNELSQWDSGARTTDAWIEYRFDKPISLSDLDLKLVGGRNQSFPMTVMVDGKTAWQGRTEPQFGYVTVSFPPVTGRTVRLALTGGAETRDRFGRIVELAQPPAAANAEAATPAQTRPALSIIEVEFLSRVGGRK